MIDHLSTYTQDFLKTKAFYQASMSVLGYEVQSDFVADWNEDFPEQRMCAFGPKGKSIFWIIEAKEAATPRHFAFTASSRESVDFFYKQGLLNSGKNNGAPGLRKHYHQNYYGAFLIDPDGNNVEAVCHLRYD